MATHSSILAWKIPWTEGPGRLQYMGHKELDMMTERLNNNKYVYTWLLHFIVQQKLTRHCKAIMPQLKKKKEEEEEEAI